MMIARPTMPLLSSNHHYHTIDINDNDDLNTNRIINPKLIKAILLVVFIIASSYAIIYKIHIDLSIIIYCICCLVIVLFYPIHYCVYIPLLMLLIVSVTELLRIS